MANKIDLPYFIASIVGMIVSVVFALRGNRTLSPVIVYVLCGIMFILCVILLIGSLSKEEE
jgi:hypothetical protein